VANPTNILAAVLQHANGAPDRTCVEIYSRRTAMERRTFGEVAAGAGRAAAFLASQGLCRGDIVVLLGTHHIDFYPVWLGCVWLGAVPTVLAEPSVRTDRETYWARLGELLSRVDGWGVAADPRLKLERQLSAIPRWHRFDEIAANAWTDCARNTPPRIIPRPEETLLLQHSSGTTGLQKGVMLSHQAVRRHAESYNRRLRLTESDCIATWLPLYHDMGFIACFVNPLWQGVPVVWLSPFEWVVNPALLLDAVTQRRATLAWLPNFAFAFLASRTKLEPGRYDLSSLRALVNCSEPVTAEAMQAFCEQFAAAGFRPEALQTCYAMAENVFAVSTTDAECPPRFRRIDRADWQSEHRAVSNDRCLSNIGDKPDGNPNDRPFDPAIAPRNLHATAVARAGGIDDSPLAAVVHVSNGRCLPDCQIRIVDEAGRPSPVGVAGRVLIRSPFLFSGYFRRDDLNADLLDDQGFFDTGDLGYLDEQSHVYITGRRKDLIIVGGKNIYPQDVEQVASAVSQVHPGRVVCFGVSQRSMATEGLVLLCETDEPEASWADLVRKVRVTIPAKLDVDLYDVRVVPRGKLRKSTSGKLARDSNRQAYLSGRFGAVPADIGAV
jgi:fatty-acyl-CoA synthase